MDNNVSNLSKALDFLEQASLWKGEAAQLTKTQFIGSVFLLALCHTLPSLADDGRVFRFNIPSEDLSAALLAFSETTDIQLSYPSTLVQGVKTKSLSGNYTSEQALQKLLSGSQLNYRLTDANVIALETAKNITVAETTPSNNGSTTLGTVKVSASSINEVDDDPTAYKATNATTATKTNTPIMETPFSIKAIPQQVLQDQQVIRVDQAVENVSGVIKSGANAMQRDTYTIRGFDTGGAGNTYRNGVIFSQPLAQLSAQREVANLERVEVLKGPASLLYGRAEPGGVINYVTKQPLATPYYSLQQQFGSYDLYRTTADATGAVSEDKSLLYRFNLAYENANSFRDFAGNEQVFIAPVLKWEISPQTRATFELEYQNWDRKFTAGIPPIGNRVASVPISTNFTGPNFDSNQGDRVLGSVNWSHDFNDQWTLSHVFQVNAVDYKGVSLFVPPPASATGDTSRLAFHPSTHNDSYFTSLNLTGKFNTWALKHTSLFGFDYFKQDDTFSTYGNIQSNFNIFAPNYNVDFAQLPATSPFSRDAAISWYGLYYQDQIELPFNLFALGGVRYDAADYTDNLASTTSDDNRVNPRGGLLWRPIKELSFYSSYTENFGANNGFDGNGNSLKPQTAEQWEVGAKTELWDGRFTASLAYYDLTKQNIAVTDPNNFQFSKAIGEAESRGLELDVAGEIVTGWKIIGGYSYMPFAKITNDVAYDGGPGTTGNRLPLAPIHSGSIWNTYEFQAHGLQGFKLGAGVVAAGDRQGNPDNSYQLPGYATVNLLASYTKKIGKAKVTTQLNANNILDKTYYTSNGGGTEIFPLAPQTFMGSVRVEY
ncbi:MAG: TonB-dependent receptor [Methylovulum sp.]|nr:TonB-dependent receptor [Methylovulum sp.]